MTESDHSRAKDLFLDALELAPEEREAFLDAACGESTSLRARIAGLLASHDIAEQLATRVLADADHSPGDTLGDYRLGEELGEGGFGRVFQAEQLRPVKRQVAIKLLKPGADSKQVVARFEAETQVLARMEHPHIAGVLDAGTSPQGRPYFVMELVDGEPITSYCAQRELGLAARLDLFRQVCMAIHHAHSKGVLHRDVKPNNVLVTEVDGEAQPRVIDFGVAKALEAGAHDESQLTVEGLFVGTPSYMSPEQMNAAASVDTRSDVYALGVLLYELVGGALPFEPTGTGVAALIDLQRMIKETVPSAPSELRKTVGAVPGAVPREVDWVCLRAIESDPERRYPTAFAFAADIARLLANQPVEAAPASATYRARKLVERHRAASVFAVAALLALAAGVTGTVVEWQRADRLNLALGDALTLAEGEATEARAQFEIAEAVNAFLTQDLLRAVSPSTVPGRGYDVRMSEVLDAAAARIDFAAAKGGRFEDKPRVEGRVRHAIGRTYGALGRDEEAVPQLERAVELLRETLGPTHAETLGCRIDLASAYQGAERNQEAAELLAELLPDARRVLGPASSSTLAAVKVRASALRDLGREEDAREMYDQGLAAARDGDAEGSVAAAGLLQGRAIQEADAGRMDAAERLFQEAIDIRIRREGYDAPSTLTVRSNYAVLLTRAGRKDEALKQLEETVPAMRRVLGDEHPDTLKSMRNLVLLRVEDGRAAESADLARAIYMTTLAQRGPDHSETLWTMDICAITAEARGESDEALRVMSELVERSERLLGPDDRVTANRVGNLGIMLFSNQRYDRAEPVLRRALALNDRLHGERGSFSLQLLGYLAAIHRARFEDYEAEVLLAEALERGGDRPPADQQVVGLRWELCQVLRDDERWDEALELLEESRSELREVHGPDDPLTLACEALIMDTLVRADQLDQARALEARLLPYLERLEPVNGADELRRPPSAE